jgi:hypothetical protein
MKYDYHTLAGMTIAISFGAANPLALNRLASLRPIHVDR